MEELEDCDIGEWVSQADSKDDKEFREAVHTILSAIASDDNLKASMILKGGILLAVRYHSHRYTKDIDLSTSKTLGADITQEGVVNSLNENLAMMVETLDYGLDCVVQSSKLEPANNPDATYPSITLKVGYAYKGSNKHKRLQKNQSPTVISIDYSLNESMPNIDHLQLADDGELWVYSLTDLIAEKYRSLLQQVSRNRNRRQDIFDLTLILGKFDDFDDVEKQKILDCLIEKARARKIEPTEESMDEPELRVRAEHDYPTLANDIEGELPNFDESFTLVVEFYRSLPWR
jgi:predicted nucleotidyltransferase component of viral defense system